MKIIRNIFRKEGVEEKIEEKPKFKSLKEIKEKIESEERKLSSEKISGEAKVKVKEIIRNIKNIESALNRLKNKIPDTNERAMAIALHMRDNFIKRGTKSIKEMKAPAEFTYEEVEEYLSDVYKLLVVFSKIIKENRYLLSFYKEELSEIMEMLKQITSENDEVKKMLEENEERRKNIKIIKKDIAQIGQLKEKLSLLKSNIEKVKGPVIETDEKEINKELSEAKEKLKKIEKDENKIDVEIINYVAPLNKPLRKIKRTCKRENSKIIEEYFESPLNFLIAEKEALERLKRIIRENIKEMKTILENKKLKERIKEAKALREKRSKIAAEIKNIENKIEISERKKMARKEIEKEMNRRREKIREIEENIEEKKEEIEQLLQNKLK